MNFSTLPTTKVFLVWKKVLLNNLFKIFDYLQNFSDTVHFDGLITKNLRVNISLNSDKIKVSRPLRTYKLSLKWNSKSHSLCFHKTFVNTHLITNFLRYLHKLTSSTHSTTTSSKTVVCCFCFSGLRQSKL